MRLYIFLLFGLLTLVGCSPSEKTDMLNIVSRSEWGSIPAEHDSQKHTIRFITIHHGGVFFTGDKSSAQYLIDLQSWSRSEKKWIDIPYHFIMDLEGIIYEARPVEYPGDTNTEYDPRGHLLICILGNYEEQELNQEQFDSLVNFLAHSSKKYDLTVDKIKSHKDYTETACPGQNIYKFLEDGSLIAAVQKRIKKDSTTLNK